MRGVFRREKVSDGEQEEEEFDRGADGVVLVAGLDVAEEDGRARHFLELRGELAQDVDQPALSILQIHRAINAVQI